VYPAQSDLKLYRGDYFEMVVRLLSGAFDGAAYVPGAPLDLTDWTGKAQIRATPDAAGLPLAEFHVDVLQPQSGQNLGMVRLWLDDTETKDLVFTSAVWDFQLTEPGGPAPDTDKVHTYLAGKVTIDKDVTR
jgi:hypothetical protein